MSDERTRILNMLSEGKISVDEAERLLNAVGRQAPTAVDTAEGVKPRKVRFLRVIVQDGKSDVNIRIPLRLLQAGMKFKNLLPDEARDKVNQALGDKGMNLEDFTRGESMNDLLEALTDMSIDIDAENGEKVKIFCE